LPKLAPSLALVGFGPAFLDILSDCSSGANVLGERLHYSLPVMSESGAPIYPSESKSVLRYSRNHKIGKLDEHLLAEAFSAPMAPSMPSFGVAAKPLSALVRDGAMPMPAPFRDEVCQPLLQCGFLLPSSAVLPPSEAGGSPLSSVQSMLGCPPLLSFSKVGESSRGGGFEEIGGPPGAAVDLSFCLQTTLHL
jgi:hypothetical protein